MAARRNHRRRTASAADADQDDDALIGARETRHLLNNRSEMHIWRLLDVESYASLAFPKPIKINARNYWRRREILAWITAQEIRTRRDAA
jgi:predicted DNA-binding transcriptional regulator AlpA